MFYPMMVNLENKKVVVIGAGKVAFRKANKFLMYGCDVTVVGIDICEKFDDIKDSICIVEGEYDEKYIKHAYIVVSATSNRYVNQDVSNYCNRNNIMCNIADDIQSSTFIIPSSFQIGDLVVGVSTMGKSPSLSIKIKNDIKMKYEGIEEKLELLGNIRTLVVEKCQCPKRKKEILNEIIYLDVAELTKRRNFYEDCSWI